MTVQERTIQDALGERFALVREIGRGGMAVVYLAHDTRQDRHVAIKVLRPDLIDSSSSERFLREIHLEGRLHHPNILPIYDSATAGPFLYYVMPFVDGETVSARIERDGPLPVADAVRIAREVSEALACAHAQGVIHRDVKPENILLSGGHAVLGDFGVAAAVAASASASLTSSGIVLGTPKYMSPEQADAAGRVDERSDIYSLGCVLYEMLAGEPPFTGRTTATIFAKHYAEAIPSLDVVRPGLPPFLVQTIERMLAKVPADRFKDAPSLIDALDRASRPPRSTFRQFIHKHRRSLIVAVGLIVIVTVSTLTRSGRRVILSWMSQPPRYVAVLPFSSSDTADAALATGLSHLFTQFVSELAVANDALWVVPAGDIRDANVRTPGEVRKIYPVDLVVVGKVRRTADTVSLGLELFDVRRDSATQIRSIAISHPSDSLSAESADVLLRGVVRLASSKSAQRTGATQAISRAQPYYLQGVGELQRTYDAHSLANAITLFRNALAADNTYAPAYAGLCQAFWEAYLRAGETSSANDARRMCDRAAELSRADPATLVSLGQTEFFNGQLDRAETDLRLAVLEKAGADAHRWLGHVLEEQGKMVEAEREYRRAIALREDIWIYRDDLGDMYLRAGRHLEAIERHREVIGLSPDNYRGYNELGVSYMFLDSLNEAEAMFHRAIQLQRNSIPYRNLGYMYLRNRQYVNAVTVLRRAIAVNQEDWWAWRWLAQAQHWSGDSAGARRSWQRVAQLVERRLNVNSRDQDSLCGLAEAMVALGDKERGLKHLTFLSSLGPKRNYTFYWAGRVYEMLGNRSAALQYIHQAIARGFDRKTVATDQWLTGLRSDPQYMGPR